MEHRYFIAGDWGTSNLRLYLCRQQASRPAQLIETLFGPGISEIRGNFEERLFDLAQEWFDQHGAIPVILSGMVGSNIGWKEAPYLQCPVDARGIADGRLCFSTRGVEFSILAGLRTINPLQAPDIMRGEELQLLGWMLRNPDNNTHQRLFALPGTHNKWVWVEGAQIKTFLTAFTGELFAVLRKHSILINDDNPISFNDEFFLQGVDAIRTLGEGHLLHALFATRSRQVLRDMPGSHAPSYLSGLLIGADVLGAHKLFSKMTTEALTVTLIGEPSLSAHYALALQHLGITAEICDTAEIALAGYGKLYENIYQNSN